MKKYLEIYFKKNWKNHGILSVRKSGNPDCMMSLPVWPNVPSRRSLSLVPCSFQGVWSLGSVWSLVGLCLPPPPNQKSGRYASSWNAFLFNEENDRNGEFQCRCYLEPSIDPIGQGKHAKIFFCSGNFRISYNIRTLRWNFLKNLPNVQTFQYFVHVTLSNKICEGLTVNSFL